MTGKNTATVATIRQLADELGVSRETIWRWKQNPAYRDKIPKPLPDQSHDVLAWHVFARDAGLGGYAGQGSGNTESFEGEYTPEATEKRTLTEWRAAEVAEKVARLQIDNGQAKRALLVAVELEEPLGATLLAIQTILHALPHRVSGRLLGINDPHEIARILREETETTQIAINAADFYHDLARLVAELPSDEESERLMALVTFEGQDRAALNALIVRVAGLALSAIGRRALKAFNDEPDAAPEIPEVPAEAGE